VGRLVTPKPAGSSRQQVAAAVIDGGRSWEWRLKRLKASRYLLLLFAPCFVYLVLFRYVPIWGILVSLKDYSLFKGFWKSPWVGVRNFVRFFNDPLALKLIKNTFLLSFYGLLFGFPTPILFALLLNETRSTLVKRWVQTISYMPHFLSTVVVVGMFNLFLSAQGFVNLFLERVGVEPVMFMSHPELFRGIYVFMDVWQGMGWGAIIYLAALSTIDPQLHEAAMIEGANKLQRIVRITIPCIAPTIMTILLLNTGSLLSVGFEKAFLMQNPANLSVSEVLSTYVYRQGLGIGDMGYATAVDVFNAVVSLAFVVASNVAARRYSEYSLL
jgi:putative aldouronate transport system permease protein